MLTRTISAFAAAGLTVVTLALATPLRAAPIDEQIVVKTGDLDLSTDRGAVALDRRVRAAAESICGVVPPTNLNMQRQVADCQADVVANARADVALALGAAQPQQRIALRAR